MNISCVSVESMSFEAPLVTELTALTDGQQNLNGSRAPGPWTSDAAGQYLLLVTEITALTDGQNLNGSRAPGPWTSDAVGQ
jgi:hypothetical protein